MRHGISGAFLLSFAMLQPGPSAAQAPGAGPDQGANAALHYWQAFAFLPALDKGQEKLLEEWNKAPFDANARKLLDAYKMGRVLFHRGAKTPRCDWGEDYEDGIRLLLPHLPKSVTLARLAALNARHEFTQGHWEAGAEDVAALMGLAGHLSADRIMISNLVGPRVEAMAIEAAAPYLPELKRALPEAAFAGLESSRVGATIPEMILMEKQMGPIWLIGELKTAERRKAGSWQDVWKEVFAAPEEEAPNPNRDAARGVKTFDQAIKALEDILPWYDKLARLAALPRPEFDAQYPEAIEKAKGASPVGGLLLPALDKFLEVHRRNQARSTLFKAAIAVVRSGPGALQGIKDPAGDGPIEYRALDRGFELKSKLIFRGNPVTLTAGQGKTS
jgi:hypothetical protein